MIYLDNAATTMKKPDCVIQAVVNAMNSFGNSGRSTHDLALDASRTIYGTREKIAAFFGCPDPSRVIFTSNSTEALNIAIRGLFSAGDHVISTDCEHNSVLRPLHDLKDVSVDFVRADIYGRVKYEDFETLIRPETKAIVCTHASNLTGNVLDVERIGTIAKNHHIMLVVDASQTAGVFPIHMEKMGISVLCFTGHKSMLAPQGTGGLCILPDIDIRPLKSGGTGVQTFLETQPPQYPTRLEAGTLNGHGIAGLNAAIDYINEVGMQNIHMYEDALARRFYEGVHHIDGVTVYGDFSDNHRAPIVTLNIGDYDSSQVSDVLAEEYGIATRAGAHCAPRMHQALGTVEQGAVRFSFGWNNTEEEVDIAIKAVKEIAQ